MTTVYGMPAVEVPQPDGTTVGYLWRSVPPVFGESRAWVVTGPKGSGYRVSELSGGGCKCSCPAWKFNRHAAGRWCDVNGHPACKHCFAIWTGVINPGLEKSQ